ncbi:hypothetical protein C8J56DRAFT_1061996 [Mycena floridula]|nr:hypothetical protein C8J56DRAFT_1061996 [Mycena floridula]
MPPEWIETKISQATTRAALVVAKKPAATVGAEKQPRKGSSVKDKQNQKQKDKAKDKEPRAKPKPKPSGNPTTKKVTLTTGRNAPLDDMTMAPVNNPEQSEELVVELNRVKAELTESQKKLQAQLDEAERQGQKDGAAPAEIIERLERPPGESGDKKRGFVLMDTMGLNGNCELYKAIVKSVWVHATAAGLDISFNFREQPAETLTKIFHMGRNKFPYLTHKRFRADWAQAKILKHAIRNMCKYGKKKGALAKESEPEFPADSGDEGAQGAADDEDNIRAENDG